MKKIFVIIFVITTNLCFSQTIIKMERNNGVYLIPCKVNGLDLKFIFDTGASDVSISLSEALFMLKNGYLTENDIIGKQSYQIANGDIETGTKIIIREMVIGNTLMKNITASVVHSTSAPLLLGQSALEQFGKYSIDYSENVLVIGESPEADKTKVKTTNNISEKLNCYGTLALKARENGTLGVSDGVYTDVIITFRKGSASDCINGKVIVKDGLLNKIFLLMDDGSYKLLKRKWKNNSNKNVSISNAFSQGMVTEDLTLINVIWPNKIN